MAKKQAKKQARKSVKAASKKTSPKRSTKKRDVKASKSSKRGNSPKRATKKASSGKAPQVMRSVGAPSVLSGTLESVVKPLNAAFIRHNGTSVTAPRKNFIPIRSFDTDAEAGSEVTFQLEDAVTAVNVRIL